jgi:hypothetical protein
MEGRNAHVLISPVKKDKEKPPVKDATPQPQTH